MEITYAEQKKHNKQGNKAIKSIRQYSNEQNTCAEKAVCRTNPKVNPTERGGEAEDEGGEGTPFL